MLPLQPRKTSRLVTNQSRTLNRQRRSLRWSVRTSIISCWISSKQFRANLDSHTFVSAKTARIIKSFVYHIIRLQHQNKPATPVDVKCSTNTPSIRNHHSPQTTTLLRKVSHPCSVWEIAEGAIRKWRHFTRVMPEGWDC